MTTPTSPPSPPRTSGAHPRYLAILALSAAAILVVGGLFRPRSDTGTAPSPQMPEGEVARLSQATLRRDLLDQTNYFRSLANDLGTAIRYEPDRGTSSVAWSMNRYVTATGAHAAHTEPGVLAPGSRPAEAISALPAGAPPLVRAGSSVAPGDWIVAVWQSAEGRAFVPGSYMGTGVVDCAGTTAREVLTSLPLTRAMAGAGIFDVYGALVGLVARCGDRLAALAAGSVDTLLAEAASVRGRLLDRHGLEVVTLDSGHAEFHGTDTGALVETVWTDWPAGRSGLRPGDVIVAVDGEPVSTPDDLAPLVRETPGTGRLTVRRGADPIELALGTEDASEPRPAGRLIGEVPPESAAARAGLRDGDLVVRVDRREVRTAAQLRPLLEPNPAARHFVEIERGGRLFGTVVE